MKSVKLNILQSSCAPLLFIMRLTGIPLDDDYTNSLNHSRDTKTRSLFTNFYFFFTRSLSFFLFFVNMESNLIFIILVVIYLFDTKNKFDESNSNNANFSTTFFWNEVIEAFNLVFITFGTHLALLASTLVHWPDVVRYLHRLEREFHLTPRLYYKRFRYISIAAFLYWMLVSFVYIFYNKFLQSLQICYAGSIECGDPSNSADSVKSDGGIVDKTCLHTEQRFIYLSK